MGCFSSKESPGQSAPNTLRNADNEDQLRSFDVDPTNGQLILDMSGLMGTVFGDEFGAGLTDLSERGLAQWEEDGIATAKAKGQHPNPQLCRMCRFVLPLGPTQDNMGFQWLLKKWFIPFGNWHQLKLRQHCVICRLIVSLIAVDQSGQELHPQLAAIDKEIQGIKLRLDEVVATTEWVLRVDYGLREVGALRLLTKTNASTALRQGWEIEKAENMRILDEPSQSANTGASQIAGANKLSDYDHGTSQQQINVSQLKSWLNHCESDHGNDCNPPSACNEDFVPIILIDVVDNCLVSATSAARYFALSYVWGAVDISSTLTVNYAARCRPNGLHPLSKLPATVADAVSFVSSLEERYLWVDALCIVQDNTEQKMRNIAHMDRIYSHATATLVALHGADANAGLSGLRPHSRPPQRVERIMIDRGSKNLDCSPSPRSTEGGEADSTQIAVEIVATPPALHLAIELEPWYTRGWTFQEQLISRRCIYFAERYVYFHCRDEADAALCESGLNGPVWPVEDFEQMEKQFGRPKAPFITSLNNPLLRLKLQEAAQVRLADIFSVYTSLVGKYTKRKLSHPGDIVNAFTGTLAALDQSLPGPILCALPAVMLDLVLLWTPVGKVTRRGGKDIQAQALSVLAEGKGVAGRALPTGWGTTEIVLGPQGLTTFDEGVDRNFPSWSWVGWEGPVEYRTLADMLPEEALPEPLIHEISVNLDGKELHRIPGRKQPQLGASTAANFLTITPTLPNVLQFVAPVLPLTAFKLSIDRKYISVSNRTHTASKQSVRKVLDRSGRHCGLWWEQAGYKYVGRGVNKKAEGMMRMVAVSVHDDLPEGKKGSAWMAGRPGPSCVDGPERLFDGSIFPAIGKGSGLVNVLVVDDDVGHEYSERMTVARIHIRAWKSAGPVEEMVRLA